MAKTGMMEIALGSGVIFADAKNGLIDLKGIEKIGMERSGTSEVKNYWKSIRNWVNLNDTQEFLSELKSIKFSNDEFLSGENELIITSGRGRNSKAWADIMVALKYAMYVDKKLEVEVLDTFINKKILDLRLLGIDYHKELMKVLWKLENFNGSFTYVDISKAINIKCNGEFISGWDIASATADKQKLRVDIINMIIKLVDIEIFKNTKQVIEFVEKY
ncbi:MAG: KilA-N domain-containing protein [Paraclostridium sp.]